MKKIETSIGEHLRPVVLYVEDLEQLERILQEGSPEVSIRTKTHQLESLTELLQLPTAEINELELTAMKPYVSVSFGPAHIWLYASDDTPAQRGVFEKIKAFLNTRKQSTWLFSPILDGLLLGAGINALAWSILGRHWHGAVVSTVGIVVAIAFAVYAHRRRFRRFSIIRPRRRAESPGFMTRNADRIVLAVISALLGGVVGVAIDRLARWLAA